jgi:hypothetical protein
MRTFTVNERRREFARPIERGSVKIECNAVQVLRRHVLASLRPA